MKKRLLIILVLVVQLASCSFQQNTLPTETLNKNIYNAELEKNRSLWQSNKIENYDFVINKMDMGTWSWIPSLIKVRNGQVISKTPTSKLAPMTRIDSYEDFETVEKIFNQIQEAYNKSYYVDVRYNEKFGYPEKTTIDNLKSTDSSVTFEITNFKVINSE